MSTLDPWDVSGSARAPADRRGGVEPNFEIRPHSLGPPSGPLGDLGTDVKQVSPLAITGGSGDVGAEPAQAKNSANPTCEPPRSGEGIGPSELRRFAHG